MNRSGNTAVLAGVILVGIGLMVLSPAVAQTVLPGSVLVHLPQFEGEEAGVTCDTIERVEAGEETLRDLFGAGDDPQSRDAACTLVCGGEDAYAGDYCGSDDAFTCVCQIEDGIDVPFDNGTDDDEQEDA